MSYADAVLDLNGVAVACLTGLNGAGKSALLDAVTWALWEEARGSSDELMRLGEKEMWVEVVFAHEGRLYRVRRSRQKQGKPGAKGVSKGTLEFQIANEPYRADFVSAQAMKDLKWNSLTAASMKETGKHISDLLRMDYDTFINSAYLKQGRAEEFTTRLPSERKQVLGEILGLSYFDRLQEEARERLRTARTRAEVLEASLTGTRAVEEELGVVEAELKGSEAEFAELSQTEADIRAKVEELTGRLQEFKVLEHTFGVNEKRLAELQGGQLKLADKHKQLVAKKEALQALSGQGACVEAQITEFNEVRAAVEKLDSIFLAVQELSEKKVNLSGELATMRSRLELKLEALEAEQRDLSNAEVRLAKDTADGDKVKASYLEFKQMLATESELSLKQEAFTQLTVRTAELASSIQESKIRLEAELNQKTTALQELEEVKASRASLSSEGAELEALREELERAEAEFELVEKKGLAIKSEQETLDLKCEEIKGRQRENLEKIRELKEHEHSSICPLCSAPIVDRDAVIKRYLKHNAEMDSELSQQACLREKINDERNELRTRYIELRKKLEKRKELDKRIGQFNEREQALLRVTENFDRLSRDKAALTEKLNGNNFAQVERESLVAVKAELFKLEYDPAVFTSIQSQIRLKRHVEGRHQQLLKDIEELERVRQKMPLVKAGIDEIRLEISSETYGQDVRGRLKEIIEQLSGYRYDRNEHARLKQRLSELFAATEKSREIVRALAEIPAIDADIETSLADSARLAAQLTELESEQSIFLARKKELSATESVLDGLKPALDEIRAQKEDAGRKVAVLSSRRQAHLEELERAQSRLKELALLKEEVEDYAYLAEVFGKKGIQAVIIENAIPEIENEANRILTRLTDNKMHVALITQAKNKSGSISETLDLVIGDEVGTRSYELYSGGEAFKVNFSLRIALSRLLARRSGAKLETLIIDEGFGSQDDASRDRLVKAIRLVQADFSRVLVITHIADVREMFPVQIQVVKNNGVSSLKLVS
jgi:exonuclease SbcC